MLSSNEDPVDGREHSRMAAQERVISISIKTILQIVLTLIILLFLWTVREIIAVVFVALFLAAVMNPFVTWLRTYKIPAALAAIVFYVLLFGAFTAAFILVIPEVLDQVAKLAGMFGDAPGFVTTLRALIDTVQAFIRENVLGANGFNPMSEQLPDLAKNVLGFMVSIFGNIVNFVLVFVLAFYMVVEEKDAMRWFKNLLPEKYQQFAANLLIQVRKKFGRWLIGQLILSLIIGTMYFIALLALGVEGALVLGIFAAFAEFIPYVGPILTGLLVVIVALAQSPTTAVFALVLMILVQQFESHVLIPKVMQKAVGLNPVVSIIAFLVGAKLFGPVGMILAIPVTTAASVAIMEYEQFRKQEQDEG
jgi:predicted PurR-regulated permease PerM